MPLSISGPIFCGLVGVLGHFAHYQFRGSLLFRLYGLYLSTSIHLHLPGTFRLWWQDVDKLYSGAGLLYVHRRSHKYVK